jgi:sec-independent protein translocase protein TatA
MSIGPWELILIFVVIAILFGGKKIPELGKGIGEGIRNFKSALKGDHEEKKNDKSGNEKGN